MSQPPYEQMACVHARAGQSEWSGLPELVCLWPAGQRVPSAWWLVSGARYARSALTGLDYFAGKVQS
jgi:hypothetical protein